MNEFQLQLNSSSLYSSVTEHTSPLISKYKPGQATKIIINTHWSGRRRHTSNHGHIQRPSLPQDTQSIQQNTHQYKMKRHCSLNRLKRSKLKVLHHYIIVKFNVSLLQWVIENFCENAFDITEESSCFNIFFGQWI